MVMLVVGNSADADIARYMIQEGYPLEVVATNRRCHEQITLSGLNAHFVRENQAESWEHIIAGQKISLLVDASATTFPGVQELMSKLAERPIYIRYLREKPESPGQPLLKIVHSFPEAVDTIAGMQLKTVFLTTGSHGLEHFAGEPRLGKTRIVARVQPEWRILKICQDLGLKAADIVAMQGPFSKRLNKALFKAYNADGIVARDNTRAAGSDTIISAALELKIPVIVIRRPVAAPQHTAQGMPQLIKLLKSIGGD